MSIALHRFARFAFRHPKRVLGGWLVLLGVVAALLATQPRSIASGFSLHGTPSQEVLDTVSARLPEAGGTQGTLVFTARDGGRIDTPARAAAIAEAADRAASTPYVVNREAKLSEQRGQVREQIAARVEQSVAAKLGPELTTLATTLDAAATRPGAQSLGGLATRARSLATASPHERIVGTTSLLADLKTLTAAMGAKGISPQALGLPAGSAAMTDPTTAVTDGGGEGQRAGVRRPGSAHRRHDTPRTRADGR
jgi:RND superfamily putative drug exporter